MPESDKIATLKEITISMQPTHAVSDLPWVPKRIGAERTKWGYRWKDVVESGALFVSGTDAPVEDIDPLGTINAASAKSNSNALQRLGEQEVLKSLTLSPAKAISYSNQLGDIALGKQLDLTLMGIPPIDEATEEEIQRDCDPTQYLSINGECLIMGTVINGQLIKPKDQK